MPNDKPETAPPLLMRPEALSRWDNEGGAGPEVRGLTARNSLRVLPRGLGMLRSLEVTRQRAFIIARKYNNFNYSRRLFWLDASNYVKIEVGRR